MYHLIKDLNPHFINPFFLFCFSSSLNLVRILENPKMLWFEDYGSGDKDRRDAFLKVISDPLILGVVDKSNLTTIKSAS